MIRKKTILFGLLSLVSYALSAQVDPDYFIQRGLQEYRKNNFDKAIPDFQRALSLDSGQKEIYYLIGSAYLAADKPTSSLAISESGLKRFPEDNTFLWMTAEAHLRLNNFKKAFSRYEKIYHNFIQKGTLPNNIDENTLKNRFVQASSKLGNNAISQGEAQRAVEYFYKANQALPREAFTYTNLALAYMEDKNLGKALATVDEGLNFFPEDESLIKAKINILYKQKNFDSLEETYQRLYESDPDNLEQAITYGEILMANQKFVVASEHYNYLLTRYPEELRIYESLIHVYESKLNYEGKIRILKQMLPYSDKKSTYKRIAESYEMMNRWEKARIYYDTVLMYTDNDLAFQYEIVNTFLAEKDYSRASQYLEDLLSEYPENPEFLEMMGIVQEKLKNWEGALVTWKKLFKANPSLFVQTRLGLMHERVGHKNKALQYYHNVLSESDDPEAYFGAARLLRENYPDSAFQLADQALGYVFIQLNEMEKELSEIFNRGSSLTDLASNRDVMEKAKSMDSLATEIFEYFTTFEYSRVLQRIRMIEQGFSQSAKFHFLVGRFFYENQEIKKALRRLEIAARLNPNIPEVHLLIGKILQLQKDNYRAILAFERVLTLESKNESAYNALVKLYREEGQLDLLCKKWLARYQADPENEELKDHLIEVLHKNGQYELARRIINENK